MIHTEKVRLAMTLAESMHRGQYDKGGFPYIYHPTHLAENASCEESAILALLHDTVEDKRLIGYDIETAARLGFAANKEVVSEINDKLSEFYDQDDGYGAIAYLCNTFGFSDSIKDAWMLLTRVSGVTYMEYIGRIKGNEYAKEVKLLDLNHNMDASRLLGNESKQSLMARYKEAVDRLSD